MVTKYPEWLQNQVGIRYGSEAQRKPGFGWLGRKALIRKYANHLLEQGQMVTLEAIRDMLRFVDRGYSLNADQISFALAAYRRDGRAPKVVQGTPVRMNRRTYPSIRAAAEGEDVSPQTVINRIKSKDRKWRSWRYAS